ncbi:MAG: amidase [Bradymonadaceae bacterium]
MNKPYLAFLFGVVFLMSACPGEFEPPVDCTDECGGECKVDDGFAFETYEPTCTGDDSGPVFCGPGETDGCIAVDFEIRETTVSDIHAGLLGGDFDCEWLLKRFHQEIFEQDLRVSSVQPPLNAFVTLNPAALETARRLDGYQRCEGELAGPLHCVPFVIKTNYGSKEVPTTNGSWSLAEAQPNFDAFVVDQLRHAGAVMMGSTNMDEYARGIHGISSRGGKTGNAFDTRNNPGGSSAGSGVAVGANMAVAGLGTDNCSSLTIPAAYNGLFTIRSSFQLVSTRGIFPSNRNDAVSGPMTRTVTDLARFFDTMAAINPRDTAHCEKSMPRTSMEETALRLDGLEGKRIGIVRDFSENSNDWDRFPYEGGSEEDAAHFASFFEELEGLGATIVDDIELPGFNGNRIGSGSGIDVDRYLENTGGGVTSFEDLCKRKLYPMFIWESEDDCLRAAKQSVSNLESNIERAREAYEKNRRYVEGILDELELDALVYPADARGGAEVRASKANCILPSVTGLPTISVHAGHDPRGLPVGMLLTARMYDETTLFEMAYAYEQATLHRRAPDRPTAAEAPGFDVERFNTVHDAIGRKVFDDILGTGAKFDLNGSNFSEIVRDVLRGNGLESLIED